MGAGGRGPLREGVPCAGVEGSGKLARRSGGTFSISFPLFQVGNLGLLFMLLFFIFAALGVELFGDLGELGWGGCRSQAWGPRASWTNSASLPLPPPECDETHPCEGLGRHATFRNFGMAFLTLFRVSTGDNWNGIMKVRAACSGYPQGGLGPQDDSPTSWAKVPWRDVTKSTCPSTPHLPLPGSPGHPLTPRPVSDALLPTHPP